MSITRPRAAIDASGHLRGVLVPHIPSVAFLLDHLIGSREQRGRNGQSECLGSLEVDCRFEFGRRLYRQISGFAPRRIRST